MKPAALATDRITRSRPTRRHWPARFQLSALSRRALDLKTGHSAKRLRKALLLVATLTATISSSDVRSDPIRVLIIGDSISTSGALGPPGLNPGVPFSDQLELKLGPDFELINVACGGSTSIDWSTTTPGRLCPNSDLPSSPIAHLGLVEEFVRPHLPVSIATILLGTNDAMGFSEPEDMPVLPDAYGAALDELIAVLLAGEVDKVILMTPPLMANFSAVLFLSNYRDQVLARCESGGSVICGPDLYLTLNFGTDFLNDGIHPNAQGHDKITEALYPQILAVPELNERTGQYVALLCVALLRSRKNSARGVTRALRQAELSRPRWV